MTNVEIDSVSHSGRTWTRFVLAALCVVFVWGVYRPLPRHGAELTAERTDSAYYSALIGRVARGEWYYSALNIELRARNYPTGSVFNWRPPTLTLALAHARLAMWILLALTTVGLVVGTIALFSRATPEIMLVALLMMIGATVSGFTPLAFVLHETWGGALIAASALLYTRRAYRAAALLGIAALFIRELAAPYVAVCAALALWESRRDELAIWIIGGLAWCAFFYWHATAASHFIGSADPAHPSWVQFGGGRFVLATIGFGGWFYYLPPWAAVIGGVLVLASPWSRIRALHIKTAALMYVALFAIIGQPFNQSWGLLTAPLWALAYGLGADGMVRLVQHALPRSASSALSASGAASRD